MQHVLHTRLTGPHGLRLYHAENRQLAGEQRQNEQKAAERFESLHER